MLETQRECFSLILAPPSGGRHYYTHFAAEKTEMVRTLLSITQLVLGRAGIQKQITYRIKLHGTKNTNKPVHVKLAIFE